MVMSGWSVNLTTLFVSRLRPPKRLASTSCTYFGNWLFRPYSHSDPGHFSPYPFRSGQFGPILGVGHFGPILVGRFGPPYFFL